MNLVKRSFRIPGELAKALGQEWPAFPHLKCSVCCPVCGAIVHTLDKDNHAEWHLELAERLG